MPLLRFLVLALAISALCTRAFGQVEPLYQGPVPARLNGKTVEIPVTLYAEIAGEQSESILMQVYARTQDLAPLLRDQLQSLAEDSISACELRISVPDAGIGVDGTQLVMSATVDAEIWVCSVVKTHLGGETARIVADVRPTVREGRLYLEPGALRIEGMGNLIASVGGDRLLHSLYIHAIDRFNPNLNSARRK